MLRPGIRGPVSPFRIILIFSFFRKGIRVCFFRFCILLRRFAFCYFRFFRFFRRWSILFPVLFRCFGGSICFRNDGHLFRVFFFRRRGFCGGRELNALRRYRRCSLRRRRDCHADLCAPPRFHPFPARLQLQPYGTFPRLFDMPAQLPQRRNLLSFVIPGGRNLFPFSVHNANIRDTRLRCNGEHNIRRNRIFCPVSGKNLNKVAWILLFPGFPPQKSPNRTGNARRTLRNHHDADQEQAQNQQSDRQPGQQPSSP